jgi:HlyD family secretion protein
MRSKIIAFHSIACIFIWFLIAGCKEKNEWDAYGNFEATEIIISSQVDGQILAFELAEGQLLKKNQFLGFIDTVQLHLARQQLLASANATIKQMINIQSQLDVLQVRKKNLIKEKERSVRLWKNGAATRQQVENIIDEIKIIDKEIVAQNSLLKSKNISLQAATDPVYIQIRMINDKIRRSHIVNPLEGVILKKYAEQYEFTYEGKPLYKVSDLSVMSLKIFLISTQLSQIQLGKKVKVFVDEGAAAKRELSGTISWISSKAEFTPKNIQTKEERINQVYAVKILVPNDGTLKIGMYGEVKF